jgi:hypothetical protein
MGPVSLRGQRWDMAQTRRMGMQNEIASYPKRRGFRPTTNSSLPLGTSALAQLSRPSPSWGNIPKRKIRSTSAQIVTVESRLTGITELLTAAVCQYMALTTFR